MSEPILEPILTLRLQFAGATDFFFIVTEKRQNPKQPIFQNRKNEIGCKNEFGSI